MRLLDEANATNRPSLLIAGLLLTALPGTGGVLLSTDKISVRLCTARRTEPNPVAPALSVTRKIGLKLPTSEVVGFPVRPPVAAFCETHAGNQFSTAEVNGGDPPTVTTVEV